MYFIFDFLDLKKSKISFDFEYISMFFKNIGTLIRMIT